MDQLLTGKARAVARRRQKRWRLTPDEWETLAKLCDVLKVSHIRLAVQQQTLNTHVGVPGRHS
jgi:hypothetical protein